MNIHNLGLSFLHQVCYNAIRNTVSRPVFDAIPVAICRFLGGKQL